MANISVSELAAALGAKYEGDASITINGAAEPQDAGPGQIAIATSDVYTERLGDGGAHVALMSSDADWRAFGLRAAILVDRPRFAMIGVTKALDTAWRSGNDEGIHESALVDPSAQIGPGATIGPFSVIGPDVVIGADAHIGSHVAIRHGAHIGPAATIFDGVKIGHAVSIGANFIAQPGAVVGSDGFSVSTPETSGVEKARETLGDRGDIKVQRWSRIHSLGAVQIGDDVELGANTCIDRGTIRSTMIGDRTKLDNLVHVGHNVQIGDDCLICGQVGIARTTRIGNNVVTSETNLGNFRKARYIFICVSIFTAGYPNTTRPAGTFDKILVAPPAITLSPTKILSLMPHCPPNTTLLPMRVVPAIPT